MRPILLAISVLLAACSGGADIEMVETMPEDVVSAVADPADEGVGDIISGLFGGSDDADGSEAIEPQESEPRRGLFGRMFSRGSETSMQVATDEGAEDTTQVVPAEETATEAATIVPASAPAPRRGLFGRVFGGKSDAAPEKGAALSDLPDAADLQYGQVVPVCGLRRGALGKEVERYPGSGYRLYDSDPSTIELRAHYVTGFSDGCPRKFIAALAVFGDPGSYETTRFEDGRNSTTFTQSDAEYQKIRARICGRPAPADCADRRWNRLNDSTVFVSVYNRFDTSPSWADMLIHDGEIVAKDFKSIQ